jgi:hypothetical protein
MMIRVFSNSGSPAGRRRKCLYEKKVANRNGTPAMKALAAKWSKEAHYIMNRQEGFDLQRVFG